ncbi:hypothetical protein SAMN05444673_4010 [Bacillus sp. OV166]|uniref:hypothetical protein n=1 Tax=Bacillus sp. OV166 TaxID=1882763 RepID=UPI000A2AA864|nr:hypothetical protein [Bacillus sp. OV166]SMQ80862.1 hypothetical protein SAMN05444673_4010 [Bacillus sp. OV166]
MKKEQKALFKEIEKIQEKAMRELAKEFGLKKRSICLFKKVGEFFVEGVYSTNHTDDNEISISMTCSIKPFSYDDLFWEIFDMKENAKEPISLRAIGAFVAPIYTIKEIKIVENSLENIEDDIRQTVIGFIDTYDTFIKSIDNVDNFNEFILQQSNFLYEDLIKMLADIQSGSFNNALNRAKELISKGDTGYLQNGNKGIYEYIVEYCEKKHNIH